jgi:hypothetical protein
MEAARSRLEWFDSDARKLVDPAVEPRRGDRDREPWPLRADRFSVASLTGVRDSPTNAHDPDDSPAHRPD